MLNVDRVGQGDSEHEVVVVSVYGARIRAGDLAGRLLVVDGKAVVHALLIREIGHCG